MTLQELKRRLALVFDDNTKTVVWKNYVDYTIWALIALSTIQIFLSTYDNIVAKYGFWLEMIDIFTTICFTIEVTLRIWTIDLVEPKYQGWWGRVRYCLSFYGLIDFVSTYSYYINFIIPLPLAALKCIRVARLLRIFRFMKSFRLLTEAISSKSKELFVSLQFLVIITIILSFILFFAENEAQPELYSDGLTPVIWAFMQYIGDPGGFAEYPPITFVGRVIACIIGVLGIAIFAVPAGLIGSAFTDVMEKDERKHQLNEFAWRINEFMLVKSIKRDGLFWPAKNVSFGDIILDLGLTEDEIVKSVAAAKNLRVKNLAAAVNEGPKSDMLVINQFYVNNDYGAYIDRKSSVTIVNPLGTGDNGLSFFTWHIAELGGFNFVANENYSRTKGNPQERTNFYLATEESKVDPVFIQYVDDITRDRDEDDWIIVIAGEQVVKNAATDFHFQFGGEKGETSFEIPNSTVHDTELLKQLFSDFSQTLEEKVQLKTDAHQVQQKFSKDHAVYYLQSKTKANVLMINVSYNLMIFNKNLHFAITAIADVLNRNLENKKEKGLHKENYLKRPVESEYWRNLYLQNK